MEAVYFLSCIVPLFACSLCQNCERETVSFERRDNTFDGSPFFLSMFFFISFLLLCQSAVTGTRLHDCYFDEISAII